MKPGRDLVASALRDPEALVSWTLAEWDLLVRQARRAQLLARICWLVQERGLLQQVPEQPRAHLQAARVVSDKQDRAIRWEVNRIRHALMRVGIPVTLLKGAAYVMAELPSAHGRLFADVDILVPKEKLAEVEAALMLHGWAATLHDAYDQRYYRTWMHELPPMTHVKRQTTIDVHHAILPETARLRPDPRKLRAAAQYLAGDSDMQVLSPADMILHSATHLFSDGELEHGLRDLSDLDSLLRHFSTAADFWRHLADRAQELDLARPLYYALRYTRHILHTPVPDSALEMARAGRPFWMLASFMDALFLRALRPDHASCDDFFTPAARGLLYVRSHWLRMPPLLLVRHLLHKALVSPKGD
jgi:hypothetical protein